MILLGSIYKFSLSGERRKVAEKLGSLRRFANKRNIWDKTWNRLTCGGGGRRLGLRFMLRNPLLYFHLHIT